MSCTQRGRDKSADMPKVPRCRASSLRRIVLQMNDHNRPPSYTWESSFTATELLSDLVAIRSCPTHGHLAVVPHQRGVGSKLK